MEIVAFIPARYDSTRFPGKPLVRIAGRPMIQHVYEKALSCDQLSEVCVATDDERILACVHGFGGKAIMTGKEHRSGTDRVTEAALLKGLEKEDIIVNIQGDQPLFQPSLVQLLVSPLLGDRSIPMSTLKCRIRDGDDVHNPNHVKVVTDRQGFAIYFSRYPIPFFRDPESKHIYYKHLGFYAFRMGFLMQYTRLPEGVLESAERLEQLRAIENRFRIKVLETAHDSIEVDVPEDVNKVEEILRG
ncbi:MAG: 3-deoxy-manno-octulosonate cytidylyltransferase [Pseudomonadota bacterium]